MYKSKKAFTIMEFIFIIVIIGIISSVVLPRLSTTRDDAKVTFCLQDITIFIRDLSSYYTSQGKFSLDMKEMSDVDVYETIPITNNGSDGEYYYVCNNIKPNVTPSDGAVTFKFSRLNINGTLQVNFNAISSSLQIDTVDGALGDLLEKKNLAKMGAGVSHFITGLRVKR